MGINKIFIINFHFIPSIKQKITIILVSHKKISNHLKDKDVLFFKNSVRLDRTSRIKYKPCNYDLGKKKQTLFD
jgi:hypothetical protein